MVLSHSFFLHNATYRNGANQNGIALILMMVSGAFDSFTFCLKYAFENSWRCHSSSMWCGTPGRNQS